MVSSGTHTRPIFERLKAGHAPRDAMAGVLIRATAGDHRHANGEVHPGARATRLRCRQARAGAQAGGHGGYRWPLAGGCRGPVGGSASNRCRSATPCPHSTLARRPGPAYVSPSSTVPSRPNAAASSPTCMAFATSRRATSWSTELCRATSAMSGRAQLWVAHALGRSAASPCRSSRPCRSPHRLRRRTRRHRGPQGHTNGSVHHSRRRPPHPRSSPGPATPRGPIGPCAPATEGAHAMLPGR